MSSKSLDHKDPARVQGATVLGPGDFPIGSVQSSILIFLASDSDHSDHLALRCKMTRDTRVRNSRWTLQKLEASGEWVGDTVIRDPLE
jgi:hypothetical protein